MRREEPKASRHVLQSCRSSCCILPVSSVPVSAQNDVILALRLIYLSSIPDSHTAGNTHYNRCTVDRTYSTREMSSGTSRCMILPTRLRKTHATIALKSRRQLVTQSRLKNMAPPDFSLPHLRKQYHIPDGMLIREKHRHRSTPRPIPPLAACQSPEPSGNPRPAVVPRRRPSPAISPALRTAPLIQRRSAR